METCRNDRGLTSLHLVTSIVTEIPAHGFFIRSGFAPACVFATTDPGDETVRMPNGATLSVEYGVETGSEQQRLRWAGDYEIF